MRLLLYVFCALPLFSFSQFLPEYHPDSELKIFSEKSAYEAGITIAKASISTKYDNQPIKKSDRFIIYDFGQGKLVGSVEVSHFKNRIDSIKKEYHRDRAGNIIYLIESKSNSTSITCREFSGEKLTELTYYQMKQTKDWNDKLSPERMIWQETITHNENRAVFRNQYGFITKEAAYSFNASNKLTSNSTYDQSGKIASHHLINYNERGNIISIEEKNFNKYLFDWKKIYEYDDQSRLIRVDYLKDGETLWFRKISYLENGLPELLITRFEAERKLVIVQLKYFTE